MGMGPEMPELVQSLHGKLDDRRKWQEWDPKDLRPLWEDAKASASEPGVDEKFRQGVQALFDGTGKQPQRETLIAKLLEWKEVVKKWQARERARQQAASRRAAAPKGGEGGEEATYRRQVVEHGDEEVGGRLGGEAVDEVETAVTTEKQAAAATAPAAPAAPQPMDTAAVAEGAGAESLVERAAMPEPHSAEWAMPAWLELLKPKHLKKLCEEQGLVSYGNSEVLAKRLRTKGGLGEVHLKQLCAVVGVASDGSLAEVERRIGAKLQERVSRQAAGEASPAKRQKLEKKLELEAAEDAKVAKVEAVAAQYIAIGQPVAQQPVHAGQSPKAIPSSKHVSLPKPRQPTKQSKGEDWIRVHIELEYGVKPEPNYQYEVEYKADGSHGVPITCVLDWQSVFCATSLTEKEKYKFRVRVKQGEDSGPWSCWSHALACKKGREPIDTETKRKMWADFYPVDGEHEKTGSRLDQPCLGCQARRVRDPEMLSPLLTNVDASHVIAHSLGGPSGDSKEDSWNLVPLCEKCNRSHQKTQNMIDWMLEEGKQGNNFMPLYELLIRLRRACIKNNLVDNTSAFPTSLSHSTFSNARCPAD